MPMPADAAACITSSRLRLSSTCAFHHANFTRVLELTLEIGVVDATYAVRVPAAPTAFVVGVKRRRGGSLSR